MKPLFASLVVPLVLAFLRYPARSFVVLLHKWTRDLLGAKDQAPLTGAQAPSVLLVLPTDLRSGAELAGMKRAITSVLRNGYLGHLTIVAAVDDAPAHLGVYRDLLAWIAIASRPADVKLYATSTGTRTGRAGAIDNAIQFVRAKVARGDIDLFPSVFFAMDADSFLAPNAIEHMVQRLRLPRWRGLRTSRPMMVVGDVQTDPRAVQGPLALAVARDALTSSSTALVCTWTELAEQAPRWTAFVHSLSVGEWCRWWIGQGAKTFSRGPSLPLAAKSEADLAWLASMARYTANGAIVLDLPKTPVHALARALRTWLRSPIAYEPMAHAFVTPPANATALFRRRMTVAPAALANAVAWSPAFAYHWAPGLAVLARLAFAAYVHLCFAWAILAGPLVHARSGGAFVSVALIATLTLAHLGSTLLALSLDRHVRRRAHLLFAVPLAVAFDLAFAFLPAVAGCARAASSLVERAPRRVWALASPSPQASSGAPMIQSDLSRLAPQSGRHSARVPSSLSVASVASDDFASLRVPYLALVASPSIAPPPEPRRANLPPPSEGKMLSIRVPPPSNVVSLAAARAKINRQIEAMAAKPSRSEPPLRSAGPDR